MKQKKTKWLIIGIVIGVLLIGAGVAIGVYFYNQNQTEETGKKKKEEKEEEVDLGNLVLESGYGVTNPEADTDGDGIKDGEEELLGLNKFSADTDRDGVEDNYELTISMTDPLLPDTDGDGILDGDELSAGLDPLKESTDGEVNDSERIFTREVELEQGLLTIDGNANIHSLYYAEEKDSMLTNLPGVYGNVYEFFLEGKEFSSATLSLQYDSNEVLRAGYKPEDLKIYQITDQLTFKPVECVNNGQGLITAKLEHFSVYAMADTSIVDEFQNQERKKQVAIVIDNSGSMYEMEGSAANDPEMKRLDMAKQIVDNGYDECEYKVSKFTASYTELVNEWTSDPKVLNDAIDSISSNENFNGTYIAYAIIQTTKMFEEKDNLAQRYIVILTDGETTESGIFSYNLNDAINYANAKGISVIAIGLGGSADSKYLMELGTKTGGAYIYSDTADRLMKIESIIINRMNYNYVDKDGDGFNETKIIADTGFDVNTNGFSFKNYFYFQDGVITEGQCFGMTLISQLYYMGKLPMTMNEYDKTYSDGSTATIRGYDFTDVPGYETETGKYMTNKEPLYDRFDFKVYQDYIDESSKRIRDTSNNIRVSLDEKWKEYAKNYPYFSVQDVQLKNSRKWEIDNRMVEVLEEMCVTVDGINETTLNENDRELVEMIRALNHYQDYQKTERVTMIDMKVANYDKNNPELKEQLFEDICNKLNQGVPLVLRFPGHVINVIRIEQALDTPNAYQMYVYNNNYPGVEHMITIVKATREIHSANPELDGKIESYYFFIDTDGTFGEKGRQIDVEFYYANVQ